MFYDGPDDAGILRIKVMTGEYSVGRHRCPERRNFVGKGFIPMIPVEIHEIRRPDKTVNGECFSHGSLENLNELLTCGQSVDSDIPIALAFVSQLIVCLFIPRIDAEQPVSRPLFPKRDGKFSTLGSDLNSVPPQSSPVTKPCEGFAKLNLRRPYYDRAAIIWHCV